MRRIKERLEDWMERRSARRISYAGACRRAALGARYLDQREPGWHRRIDPDRLEVGRGSSCVLGQLHGSFLVGLARMHLIGMDTAPAPSPVEMGFVCVRSVSATLREQDYEYLNQAWQEEVTARMRWEEEAVGHLLALAQAATRPEVEEMPA